MATQFQLNAQQIRDFRIIRDIENDKFAAAVRRLDGAEPTPLKPSGLAELLKQDLPDELAELLIRVTLSLNVLMRQTGIDVNGVFEGIRFGIKHADPRWSDSEIKRWTEVEAYFRELLSCDAFRRAAKAIDLSYDYANLYRSARIVTDIRPIFSKDAGVVEGAVISYTLRIRFDNVEGEHSLSIAMDEGDIRQLMEQCDRALIKAQTSRREICDKIRIPNFIAGEQRND